MYKCSTTLTSARQFLFLFALNQKEKILQCLFGFAASLSIVAIICSETRGVILCIPVLFLAVLFVSSKKIKLTRFILFIICFFGIFLVFFLTNKSFKKRIHYTLSDIQSTLRQSGFYDGTTSISLRYEYINCGIKVLPESPLFGLGRAGFVESMIKQGFFQENSNHLTHLHNEYLSALVMRGFWGGFFLIFFISSLFLLFYKLSKRNGGLYPKCGMIFLFAYCLYFLTDSPLIGSMHSVIFFITTILVLFYASLNSVHDKKCL